MSSQQSQQQQPESSEQQQHQQKQKKKAEFKTRKDLLKELDIPQSSEKIIIVQPNEVGLGFMLNCYNSQHQIASIIDKNVFDMTVQKANKICQDIWKRKRNEEDQEFNIYLKYVFYFSVLLFIIAFFFIMFHIYNNDTIRLLYAAVALIGFSTALNIVIVIKCLLAKPEFIDLEQTIKQKLSTMLNEENVLFYQSKNLQWQMDPINFFWLELHITSA